MHIVKLLQTWLIKTEGNMGVMIFLGKGSLYSPRALSSSEVFSFQCHSLWVLCLWWYGRLVHKLHMKAHSTTYINNGDFLCCHSLLHFPGHWCLSWPYISAGQIYAMVLSVCNSYTLNAHCYEYMQESLLWNASEFIVVAWPAFLVNLHNDLWHITECSRKVLIMFCVFYQLSALWWLHWFIFCIIYFMFLCLSVEFF